MKVLLSHMLPFSLAHGGTQTVITELMREYRALGLNAEYERWWLDEQPCDVIHTFGRPAALNVSLARKKGIATVMTEYLDQVSSRSFIYRFLQRQAVRFLGGVNAGGIDRLGWEVYKRLDAMVYTTPYEWSVAQYIFGANPERGHIIPHGLTQDALDSLAQPAAEGDYLVSVGTITERKNSVMLAQAAIQARVPVHFIGKPYAEDAYFAKFRELVDSRWVHYHGFVDETEKYKLLTGARGFVLLSLFESGCVAVYEAAAAGLPLLLPKLPWAKTGYPAAKALSFTSVRNDRQLVGDLTAFYENSRRLSTMTFPVASWREIAIKYVDVYQEALKTHG